MGKSIKDDLLANASPTREDTRAGPCPAEPVAVFLPHFSSHLVLFILYILFYILLCFVCCILGAALLFMVFSNLLLPFLPSSLQWTK